jgi:hypothetical protein
MKISKIILIVCIALAGFVSCSKDNNNNNAVSIEGRWEGSYVNQASGNSFYFSFNIKPGGVIEEINSSGQKVGEGSWQLQNNIFTANYEWTSGTEFSVLAAFYSEDAKLLGDWGYGNSVTDGGTWEMSKLN